MGIGDGTSSGCCKGLLWLKRLLEYTGKRLRTLGEAPRTRPMKDCAYDAYARRLKPYHGWISSGAFSVVMSLPPSRSAFALPLILTSEPTRRTPISYAVFFLKKKMTTRLKYLAYAPRFASQTPYFFHLRSVSLTSSSTLFFCL